MKNAQESAKAGGGKPGKEKYAIVVLGLAYLGLAFYSTELARASAGVALDYFLEMLIVIPPVFVLMGLFSLWVPNEMIQRYLGRESGFRGLLISYVMGTLPTGPVYLAFPLAAVLLNKGARLRNVVVFLGIWAASKLPQILIEIKFLGLRFALTRHILTIAAIVCTGYIMEVLVTQASIKQIEDSDFHSE
ncbi:MAG: permease [Clostridia bacterium]